MAGLTNVIEDRTGLRVEKYAKRPKCPTTDNVLCVMNMVAFN